MTNLQKFAECFVADLDKFEVEDVSAYNDSFQYTIESFHDNQCMEVMISCADENAIKVDCTFQVLQCSRGRIGEYGLKMDPDVWYAQDCHEQEFFVTDDKSYDEVIKEIYNWMTMTSED